MDYLHNYLLQLLVKTRLAEAAVVYLPVLKNKLNKPQIVWVELDLQTVVQNLSKKGEETALDFLKKIEEKAFLLNTKEIRLSWNAKIGDGRAKNIRGSLVFVFFGKEDATKMLSWLSEEENQACLHCVPQLSFQDFEDFAQYEQEIARLETPKA